MSDADYRCEGRQQLRPLATGNLTRGWKGPLARVLTSGLVLFMTVGVVPTGWAQGDSAKITGPTVSSEPTHHPRENTYLKRQWGVEVLYVRQSAAGYMLEFRYKVLDANKAAPLFERQIKPMLTHVESGARFVVPTPAKTGALRNSNPPINDTTYWMFFANPGKLVKPGDHVNIEIGEFKIEGLVVQ